MGIWEQEQEWGGRSRSEGLGPPHGDTHALGAQFLAQLINSFLAHSFLSLIFLKHEGPQKEQTVPGLRNTVTLSSKQISGCDRLTFLGGVPASGTVSCSHSQLVRAQAGT